MSTLDSFESADGTIHVLGTGRTDVVLRVLIERAERHGEPKPTGVVDADLTRQWVRRTRTHDGGIGALPCEATDLHAELMTSWKPPTAQKEVMSECDAIPRTETGTTS